ncbi:hypothetical protein ABIC10_006398 [Bradyrhizobium sp. S3.2.12]
MVDPAHFNTYQSKHASALAFPPSALRCCLLGAVARIYFVQ